MSIIVIKVSYHFDEWPIKINIQSFISLYVDENYRKSLKIHEIFTKIIQNMGKITEKQ